MKGMSRNPMVIPVLFLMLALLAGCASQKPFWGSAEEGFILEYRMPDGLTLAYDSDTEQNTNMEMMGRSIETVSEIGLVYTLKGKGLNQDMNYEAAMVVDSMRFHVTGVQGEQDVNTDPLTGSEFTLVFSPLGEEKDYVGIDSLAKIQLGPMGGDRNIKSFVRDIFPDLPAHPVKIGESWTQQDTVNQNEGGMDVEIVIEATHTLEGMETLMGMECLKITSKGSGTLDGSGENMGMHMVLEGDMDTKGTWYFAYKKGMFLKSTSDAFMEGTLALTGQANMTIPMTQETKSAATLVQ